MFNGNEGYLRALMLLILFLVALLLSFSFIIYPLLTSLKSAMTESNMWTAKAEEFYNKSLWAITAFTAITVVGVFIWFLARLAKREEYEWYR